jgi:hypothetical protein
MCIDYALPELVGNLMIDNLMLTLICAINLLNPIRYCSVIMCLECPYSIKSTCCFRKALIMIRPACEQDLICDTLPELVGKL